MSDVNFDEILNTSFDTIEKPLPLPTGTYEFVVVDFATGTSQNKGTPYIELQCQPLAPGPDVDQTNLDLAKLAKRKLRFTFWMTEDAKFRFKDFLKARGIDTSGQTIKSILPQVKGITFKGAVTQAISEKTGDIFNNIDKVIG